MGWNPFSPEVNEGQSLGYNARAPVRFGATGGLTEEEFDIFVRGYLIDSAYPGTPDQDKVSKKRVASTDQESFVELDYFVKKCINIACYCWKIQNL